MTASPEIPQHILAQLENDIGIVCEGGYKGRCTQQAAFIVKIHQIDNCKSPYDRLDEHGNRICLLCKTCVDAAAWRIGETIGEIYANLPDIDRVVECHCHTCDRRILDLHDVFSMERL